MGGKLIEGKISILRSIVVDFVPFCMFWRNACKDIELFFNYLEIWPFFNSVTTLILDHMDHSFHKVNKHTFTEHNSVPRTL